MSRTAEGVIKDQVKALLKKHKVYYHMAVLNGMGAPSLDFICCHDGRYIAIETKAPGKKPTPRQEITMNEIAFAGGFVFVVSCQQELDILEAYLNLIGPEH
jgi:hypothetical protein